MGEGPRHARKKGTRNEMRTPIQMKSGDWSESKNLARTRNLAMTRIEYWAKTRSEETRSEDDDWPGWGMLGKAQAGWMGWIVNTTVDVMHAERLSRMLCLQL